jgi:hypothetical protein
MSKKEEELKQTVGFMEKMKKEKHEWKQVVKQKKSEIKKKISDNKKR